MFPFKQQKHRKIKLVRTCICGREMIMHKGRWLCFGNVKHKELIKEYKRWKNVNNKFI